MSYLALYRKYRPSAFDEVKGQDHVVSTLKNQINTGRVGHAYLFCGTRGTGKTSVAKLFAKAVNCESPIDGSPCGNCPACKAIEAHTSMNVIEIDAASNNSVNNVRDIIEEVKYSPAEGKYKVYIIDEVHMLSIGAFNALLKTLEEPPSYVIFILATTEANKLPITILSRCQRYDFKRISVDTITECLKGQMVKEGIGAEDKALRYVAKAADGSMRDAQSLLDQCLALYMGQELTFEKVLEALGSVDIEVFASLMRQITGGHVNRCLEIIDEIALQGREMSQFINDLVGYLRNLLIIKTAEYPENILQYSAENIELMRSEARGFEEPVLIRYIQILSELSNRLRYAVQKRLLVEVEIIRLCRPEMENNKQDLTAVINRIANIEKQLESGVITKKEDDGEPSSTNPYEPVPIDVPLTEKVEAAARNWDAILRAVSDRRMQHNLKNATVSSDGDKLLICVDSKLHTEGDRQSFSDALLEVLKVPVEFEFKVTQDGGGRKVDDIRERLKFAKKK